MSTTQYISIIVPLYNEADNLARLHDAICCVMDRLFFDFEIIFVDDGSSDNSVRVIRELNAMDPRVKLVALSRNFGKQTAIVAGLQHADGAAVVVMDADLQHPPEVLARLLESWKEGNKVVFAVQEKNEGAGLISRSCSELFARAFKMLVRLPRTAHPSDFVLLDSQVVSELRRIRERNTFFRYVVAWVGFQQASIPYVAAKRFAGRTKYSPRKLINAAVDAITAFSSAPLRLCTYLGFCVAACCVPYALWAVYVRLFTDSYIPGWPAIIVAILFLGAVQLIGMGILGEYIGRIYDEVKIRPNYIAQEVLGFDRGQARTRPVASPANRRAVLPDLELELPEAISG